MATYVCDFSAVEVQGENTCDNAEDMNNNLDNYQNSIKDNLSGWMGSARDEFDNSNAKIVQQAYKLANVGDSLGVFILIAKNAIYELEQDLSTMNI